VVPALVLFDWLKCQPDLLVVGLALVVPVMFPLAVDQLVE